MVLAWKKFQVSEALMLSEMPSVCDALPSVSENARNSAKTAINSAICLLECAACWACSACSSCSCGPAIVTPPLRFVSDDLTEPNGKRKRKACAAGHLSHAG